MLTLLLYVLIVGLVAALLFLVASAVFGRGEELGPLPEGTTVTVLPAAGIRGSDVRALRFQQVFRGYKAGEVDWALSRLAARIDELELQLERNRVATPSAAGEPETSAAQPNTGSTLPPTDTPPAAANGTTTNFSTGTFFGAAPFAGPGSATPHGIVGPTSAGPGTPALGAPFGGPGGMSPTSLGGPASAGPSTPTVGGAPLGGPTGATLNGLGGPASAGPGNPAFGAPAGPDNTALGGLADSGNPALGGPTGPTSIGPVDGFGTGFGPGPGFASGAGLTPEAGLTAGPGVAISGGFGNLPIGPGTPTGTTFPVAGYSASGYAPATGTTPTVPGPGTATPTESTVGEPGRIGQTHNTLGSVVSPPSGVTSPTDATAQAAVPAPGSVQHGTTPQTAAGGDAVAPTGSAPEHRPGSEPTTEPKAAGTTGYIAAPGPEQNTGFVPATEASATGWAPPPLPGDPPASAGGLR